MSICCAKDCSSDDLSNPELSFHNFPLDDPQLLDHWLKNIGPPNFQPQPEDAICSLHFTDDQFLDTLPRRLTRYAVPTLLFIDNKYVPVLPDNNEEPTNSNNKPDDIKDEGNSEEIESESSPSVDTDSVSDISSVTEEDSDSEFEPINKRKTRSSARKTTRSPRKKNSSNGRPRNKKMKFTLPRLVGDFKESDLNSPEKMRKMWMLVGNQIDDQKKKLRTIQQKNRRLESQVIRLKNIVKHLKSVHR